MEWQIRLFASVNLQDLKWCSKMRVGPANFESITYCKSTNFGVLLYLANLANCVFSLIFVAAKKYVDRTLYRRAAGRRQI